ncbi:MAG TPA: ankyrin repeat domain-containing protein, partial [Pseudonocardia sp.]|nr:ankyrin repeat domain-containing protein [Pseudonocardia sp.]
MEILRGDDPVAVRVVQAIRAGDIGALHRILGQHPGIASASIQDSKGCSRTPMHVATDWPGYFPHG